MNTAIKFLALFLALLAPAWSRADTSGDPQMPPMAPPHAPSSPQPGNPAFQPASSIPAPIPQSPSASTFDFLEGYYFGFSFSNYRLTSASPLAYGISIGYEFANGMRVAGSMDFLYYTGRPAGIPADQPDYEYNSMNVGLSAAYHFRAGKPFSLLAGAQADFYLAPFVYKDAAGTVISGSDGFSSLSPLVAGLWSFNRHWEAFAQVRVAYPFGNSGLETGLIPMESLGINYFW